MADTYQPAEDQTLALQNARVAVLLEPLQSGVEHVRAEVMAGYDQNDGGDHFFVLEADEAETSFLLSAMPVVGSFNRYEFAIENGEGKEILEQLAGLDRPFTAAEALALRVLRAASDPLPTVYLEAHLRYAFEIPKHTFSGSFEALMNPMRGHLVSHTGRAVSSDIRVVQLGASCTDRSQIGTDGLGTVRIVGKVEIGVRFDRPVTYDEVLARVAGLTLCFETEPGIPSPYGAALRDPVRHGQLQVVRVL